MPRKDKRKMVEMEKFPSFEGARNPLEAVGGGAKGRSRGEGKV